MAWWAVVVSICAGVVTIGGAWIYVYKAVNFLQQPQKQNEERFEEIERKLDNDNKRLKEQEEILKQTKDAFNLSLKNDLVILRHLATSNNTGEINETIHNVEDWLINRSF